MTSPDNIPLKLANESLTSAEVNKEIEEHKGDAQHAMQEVNATEPDMHLPVEETDKSECHLSETDSCPLSKLQSGPNAIYTGGLTRCLFAGAGPYAFRVYPGNTDELLFYFQGGGACFNEYSSNPPMCKTGIYDHPTTGVFNRANIHNPFRNFSILQVVYCSGDLHIGNVSRSYMGENVEDGPPVQRGAINTQAALDWAVKNFPGKLKNFAVAGCSAGSIGAQLWSGHLLRTFRYDHGVVIGDSYIANFPGTQEQIMLKDFGACTGAFLTNAQRDRCLMNKLTVLNMLTDAITAFPDVTFAHVNSKEDWTQTHFHQAVGWSSGVEPEVYDEPTFYAAINQIMDVWNSYPNYVSYIVQGGQHCFLPVDDLFGMDPAGYDDKECAGVTKGSKCLARWVSELIDPSTSAVQSVCEGPVLKLANWTGSSYCDEKLHGKVFERAPVCRGEENGVAFSRACPKGSKCCNGKCASPGSVCCGEDLICSAESTCCQNRLGGFSCSAPGVGCGLMRRPRWQRHRRGRGGGRAANATVHVDAEEETGVTGLYAANGEALAGGSMSSSFPVVTVMAFAILGLVGACAVCKVSQRRVRMSKGEELLSSSEEESDGV